MMFKALASLAVLAASAMAAAPTTAPPTGKAFDHIFIVFLENTDYSSAATTPALEAFLPQGILLDTYYGVTHPSEPNYIAVAGGDYFGLNDDAYHAIPANYTTIVDLLEAKNLTWRAYEEDAPSPCYTGFEFNGTYFRKHNPFIIYDSIATNPARCANVVPLTQLYDDLNSTAGLPNYAFVTPNMDNDGHNTSVSTAATWFTGFITPLLKNTNFMKRTLVVVTFDESETYSKPNNVWTMLLGDAVPTKMQNTTDSTFYTHYSLLSTVEQNWGLGNLGRMDTNVTLSNVFSFVATAANYTNQNVTNPPLLNGTEPGFLAPAPSSSSPSSNSTSAPTSSTSAATTQVPKLAAAVFAIAAVLAAML